MVVVGFVLLASLFSLSACSLTESASEEGISRSGADHMGERRPEVSVSRVVDGRLLGFLHLGGGPARA